MIKKASSYLAAFLLMTMSPAPQQPAQPAFEVASIKRNLSGETRTVVQGGQPRSQS